MANVPELPRLDVTTEQIRGLVIEFLKDHPAGQLNDMWIYVANKAVEWDYFDAPKANPTGWAHDRNAIASYRLCAYDFGRACDIVWDLILEGLVRPGQVGQTLTSGMNLPFYHITPYGSEKIAAKAPIPYDPDGYLKTLKFAIPDLDPVILTYLEESLRTFRIGCLLSSSITLGCASEKGLILLFEAFAMTLSENNRRKFYKEIEGRSIRRQFDEFQKRLEGQLIPKLPGDIKEHLDIALNTLAALFREMRNDSGHPTGKVISREAAYMHLAVFPNYIRKVYELIHWLNVQGTHESEITAATR